MSTPYVKQNNIQSPTMVNEQIMEVIDSRF